MKRYEVMLELFFECLLIVLQIICILYFLPKLLGFLWPFVTGWVIAMVTYPLSTFFQKRFHINQKYMSALILIGLLAAVSGLVYFVIVNLGRETLSFMADMPGIYQKVQTVVDRLITLLSKNSIFPISWKPNMDTLIQSARDYLGTLVNQIGSVGVSHAGSIAKNVTNFFIGFIVSLLSAYFFVAYREKMTHDYRNGLPTTIQQKIDRIIEQVKDAVGGYLIAQLKLMGIVFLILLMGLFLMKNPYSLLLAFLIAIVDVLPFLGTGFILIPWALYSLVVTDYRTAIWLFLLYLICLLSRQLLQPKIIGDSVGLDPMITLLLIYVGFKLDGLRGFLVAMIFGILIRNFYKIGLFDNKIKRFQRLFQLLRKAEEELE